MRPAPDDMKMLISQCKAMNIEELKKHIVALKAKTDCSHQAQFLNIAKKELEFKEMERQEQIELLTKSLTSSSRIGRWISSAKSVMKQFLEFKN